VVTALLLDHVPPPPSHTHTEPRPLPMRLPFLLQGPLRPTRAAVMAAEPAPVSPADDMCRLLEFVMMHCTRVQLAKPVHSCV